MSLSDDLRLAAVTPSDDRLWLETAADEIERLTRELTECRAECEEQARLNGMGAERELALIGKIERLTRELAEARKALRPFATLAESADRHRLDDGDTCTWRLYAGHLRRARAMISRLDAEEPK